jgi:hypothetical protein
MQIGDHVQAANAAPTSPAPLGFPGDIACVQRVNIRASTLTLVPHLHRWSVGLCFSRTHFTTTVPVIFG